MSRIFYPLIAVDQQAENFHLFDVIAVVFNKARYMVVWDSLRFRGDSCKKARDASGG